MVTAQKGKGYYKKERQLKGRKNSMESKLLYQPSNISTSLSKWKLLDFLSNSLTQLHYIDDLQMTLELHVRSVKAGHSSGIMNVPLT